MLDLAAIVASPLKMELVVDVDVTKVPTRAVDAVDVAVLVQAAELEMAMTGTAVLVTRKYHAHTLASILT
jgi:hypothetical protein